MKGKTGKFILSVAAYLVLSMVMVSLWHFAFFKDHYESISIVRSEPLMQLGLVTMILQGCVLAFLYPVYSLHAKGSSVGKGLTFGLLMGIFLGTYLSLAEAGKYMVPSVWEWIAVEGSLSMIQFALVGVALGFINSTTEPAT